MSGESLNQSFHHQAVILIALWNCKIVKRFNKSTSSKSWARLKDSHSYRVGHFIPCIMLWLVVQSGSGASGSSGSGVAQTDQVDEQKNKGRIPSDCSTYLKPVSRHRFPILTMTATSLVTHKHLTTYSGKFYFYNNKYSNFIFTLVTESLKFLPIWETVNRFSFGFWDKWVSHRFFGFQLRQYCLFRRESR